MLREYDLPARFKEFIQVNHLILQNESILVAYSGGADSTLLLHLLKQLQEHMGLQLFALHFHHGLRKESDLELISCRSQCEEWNIPFYSQHLDVDSFAQENNVALEEAGRILRYRALRQKKEELNCSSIATAHHADDVSETFLMHLFKGSGLSGLASLKTRRDDIIRPILFCKKINILKYLEHNNISYVTDKSNLENDFQRNFLRNEVIPLIEQRFPALTDKIQNLCAIIEGEDEDWSVRIMQLRPQIIITKERISIPAFLFKEHSAALMSRLLRELIRELMGPDHYPTYKSIQLILSLQTDLSGNRCALTRQGLRIDVSHGDVILYKKNENFPLPEIYVKLKQSEIIVLPQGVLKCVKAAGRLTEVNTASLKYCDSFKIRSWKSGDRFYLSETKSQKLQDFFVNNKIKTWQKIQTLVVLNKKDEVMTFFIPQKGWRVSAQFYVKLDQEAIHMELSEG